MHWQLQSTLWFGSPGPDAFRNDRPTCRINMEIEYSTKVSEKYQTPFKKWHHNLLMINLRKSTTENHNKIVILNESAVEEPGWSLIRVTSQNMFEGHKQGSSRWIVIKCNIIPKISEGWRQVVPLMLGYIGICVISTISPSAEIFKCERK